MYYLTNCECLSDKSVRSPVGVYLLTGLLSAINASSVTPLSRLTLSSAQSLAPVLPLSASSIAAHLCSLPVGVLLFRADSSGTSRRSAHSTCKQMLSWQVALSIEAQTYLQSHQMNIESWLLQCNVNSLQFIT